MSEQDIDHLVSRIPRSNEEKVQRVLRLTRMGHAHYQPWARAGLKARRYYLGHQWDDMATLGGRRRLRLTDNIIRDDIDKKVARWIEADPIMETHGRGPEDFELGDVWKDLLVFADEWTGDYHDSAKDVRLIAWTDTHVVGDSFEWVTWDANEEGGLGMVVSEYVPAFNVVWDREAQSVQLRDARWLCRFEPVEIEVLEQEFRQLRGRIKVDVPDLFLSGYEQARGTDYEAALVATTAGAYPAEIKSKAYRMEFWEKRAVRKTRFLLDGVPAKTQDAEGNAIDLTEEYFERLPRSQQRLYEEVPQDSYELWKTVVAGGWKASEEISEYDASKGGHGHYPCARYADTRVPEQTHARGEVEPLMGHQDVANQMMSYGLESLFLESSSILAVQRGGQPKSEEAKLDRIGEVPLQKFYYYPNSQLPQSVPLGGGRSAQLFQAMHTWIVERKDRQSQTSDFHRAAPKYDLSGRALQALLSEADLSTSKLKRNIEIGLAQATMLRIAVMQQFMRHSRMVRISARADREGYKLFVTSDQQRTVEANRLQSAGPDSDFMLTPEGDQARVLEISDPAVRKFDLRLRLDTGKARNRAERMDLVTQILNYMGPGAGVEILLWAAELMEVPNLERLATSLREEDNKTRIVQEVDRLQKETGMSLGEIAQLATRAAALAAAAPAVPQNGRAALAPAGVGA